MRCRFCGCTDTQACPGGCWWSRPEVCSNCADRKLQLLKPCPFCEGPPLVLVSIDTPDGGIAPVLDDYGDDGLQVCAFVFCHECGADGPDVQEVIDNRHDYLRVERQAVDLWQDRTARNRARYAAGNKNGLNLYPREPRQ